MDTVQQIFQASIGLINATIALLIGVAVLLFIWGVFNYFRFSDSAEKRSSSSKYIVYGLISILVITSLWGFVYMLADTLDINIGRSYQGDINIPDANTAMIDKFIS